MGKFNIAYPPQIEMKAGDTEEIKFDIIGFNITDYTVKFKAHNANGNITKQSGSGITVSTFSENKQTVEIEILPLDTKTLKGILDYEVQLNNSTEIHTIIAGKAKFLPELITN